MIEIPTGLLIFGLGVISGLIGYIWKTLSAKINKNDDKVEELDKKVNSLDIVKCRECEPVTVNQVKEIVSSEFDKFRLELYRSGVIKPDIRRKKQE